MRKKFITLFIAAFSVMLGMGIIVPLMPLYAESLGATGIWLGIIFAGYSVANLIFTPFMGKISDKSGRKKFICIGLLLYAVLSLGYLFASNVYSLTWVRFLHGFASAMVLPLVMAYIGDIAPRGKEGKFMGYFNVSLFIGMGLGPFIGGILTDSFGMSSAFYAMCGLCSVSLIVTFIFLEEETPSILKKSENEEGYGSFNKLLRSGIVRGLLAFRFISAFGNGAVMAFLPLFAASQHISMTEIGIIITINLVLTGVLQIPFGKLADKYSKFKLIIISGVITALALFIMPFSNNTASLLIINILLGAGGAIGMPAATAVTAKIGKEHGMGTTMSLFTTAMSAGLIASPLISGLLMDTVGVEFIFYFGGLTTFIGTLVFYFFVRKDKEKNQWNSPRFKFF